MMDSSDLNQIENITKTEKYAIVSVLSQIMNADGVIHPKEVEFMDSIYKKLGITIEEIQEVMNLDPIQAKIIIDEMSIENKQVAKALFDSMAISDGFVHPKETAIIESLFSF